MGMNLECFGSIHAPVPGLITSLVILVELGHEGLNITVVLDGLEASVEVLSQVQLLIDVGDGSLY